MNAIQTTQQAQRNALATLCVRSQNWGEGIGMIGNERTWRPETSCNLQYSPLSHRSSDTGLDSYRGMFSNNRKNKPVAKATSIPGLRSRVAGVH